MKLRADKKRMKTRERRTSQGLPFHSLYHRPERRPHVHHARAEGGGREPVTVFPHGAHRCHRTAHVSSEAGEDQRPVDRSSEWRCRDRRGGTHRGSLMRDSSRAPATPPARTRKTKPEQNWVSHVTRPYFLRRAMVSAKQNTETIKAWRGKKKKVF